MPDKRSNSVTDISHHNGARLHFDCSKADLISACDPQATYAEYHIVAMAIANDAPAQALSGQVI